MTVIDPKGYFRSLEWVQTLHKNHTSPLKVRQSREV